ncbi:hypothetical protein VKT23_008538 [Stygiomarasmius scandens]
MLRAPPSPDGLTGPLCTKCQAEIVDTSATLSWKSHLCRIDELLESNDPPAPDEAEKMRASFADAKRRYQSIEQELGIMEQRRVLLQMEKKDISKYLGSQKRILEPIRSMPVEILEKIFTICIDDATDPETRHYDDPLSTKSVRWIIGYVCRRWRMVSLSTPMMWDNIQLNVGTGGYESASIRNLLLSTHIQRSNSLPLTVGLYGFSPRFTEKHPFLITILAFAARWQRLHIIMKPRDMQRCLSYIQPFLASLKALTTYQDRHFRNLPLNYHSLPDEHCDVFHGAVSLTSVRLTCQVPLINLLWDRLHSLTLTCSVNRVSDVLNILRLTKNLEKLYIGEYSLDTDGIADTETTHAPLSLTALKVLQFRSEAGLFSPLSPERQRASARRQFLNTLSIPNLEIFIDNGLPIQPVSMAYLGILQRSGCKGLMDINFGLVAVPEDEFYTILVQNPYIKSLAFRSENISNKLIKYLSYRPTVTEDCALPKLDCLTMNGTFNFEAEMCADMIESRHRAHHAGKAAWMHAVRLYQTAGSLASSEMLSKLERLKHTNFFFDFQDVVE